MALVACGPSFICTFCWSPQRSPSQPKVLGREARIACEWCWKSVLDLSICWVCGELVVRGEEVVSLGWCFWHRSCFGCLLCGTGLAPPPLDETEEKEEEEKLVEREGRAYSIDCAGAEVEGSRKKKKKRYVGVELEYIPLCMWCENATENMAGKDLLETGLVNVTRRDGGLSRSRFDLLSKAREGKEDAKWWKTRTAGKKQKEKDAFMTGEIRTSEAERVTTAGHTAGDTEVENDYARFTGLSGDAVHMPITEDSKMDKSTSCSVSAYLEDAPMASPIYISVSNVLGEYSFRPSKTKPLPKWMSLLPQNRNQIPNVDSVESTANSILGCGSEDLVSSSANIVSAVPLRVPAPGSNTMSLSKDKDVNFPNRVGSREPQIAAFIHSSPHGARNRHQERKETSYLFRPGGEHYSSPSIETRSLFPQIDQTAEISASRLHTNNVSISDTLATVAGRSLLTDSHSSIAKPTLIGDKSLFFSPTKRTHYAQKRDLSKSGGVWKRYMARDIEPDLERAKRQRVQKGDNTLNKDDDSGHSRIEGIPQDGELEKRDPL